MHVVPRLSKPLVVCLRGRYFITKKSYQGHFFAPLELNMQKNAVWTEEISVGNMERQNRTEGTENPYCVS